MTVINIHERILNISPDEAGKLIDGLSSADDRLWPHDRWPAMKFDRPLGVGAVGGHGPIRYSVESYTPGKDIRFQFTAPEGFIGSHRFELQVAEKGKTMLRHTIEMRLTGKARLVWPLIIRPLHDALLEDALDRAENVHKPSFTPRTWSPWVRILKRIMKRRRSARNTP